MGPTTQMASKLKLRRDQAVMEAVMQRPETHRISDTVFASITLAVLLAFMLLLYWGKPV